MKKGPIQILKCGVLSQINGNDVRTITDAEEILDRSVLALHGRLSLNDHHDPRFVPGMLTNLTLLLVKKPRKNHDWKDNFSSVQGISVCFAQALLSLPSLLIPMHSVRGHFMKQ